MRLLLPNLDRRRGAYNAKEMVLAKTYVSALDLGPASHVSERLLHWKDRELNQSCAGDFSGVLHVIVRLAGLVSDSFLTCAFFGAAAVAVSHGAAIFDGGRHQRPARPLRQRPG